MIKSTVIFAPLKTPEKYGVEVELMSPLGLDRQVLAKALAGVFEGSVKPFFHLDSEPSKVKGKPIFYHLTQAFEVANSQGKPIAYCVDDITLQEGLDKKSKPKQGWYRLLSDDVRFLRLIMRHADASQPIDQVLDDAAKLFGCLPEAVQGGVYKLVDEADASIALAAPLPGERERPCELVTAPIPSTDTQIITQLLKTADSLNYLLPKEGATHLHFDGAFFSDTKIFLNTVRLLGYYRLVLRRMLNTNLNCRRIGDWSKEVNGVVQSDEITDLSWAECRAKFLMVKQDKYCDFNIRNLLLATANKHTLEVRILPATLNADEILRALRLFHGIFDYAATSDILTFQHQCDPTLDNAKKLLNLLKISPDDKSKHKHYFSA